MSLKDLTVDQVRDEAAQIIAKYPEPMKVTLTETEFLDGISLLGDLEILDYVKAMGVRFEPELLGPVQGVYKREHGMDLIEFDGNTWRAFNPTIVGTPIVWGFLGRCDWWVQVLTASYFPVVDGFRVQFDRDGRRVG